MERNASQLAAVKLENESGHQSWEVVLQDTPNHRAIHYSINNPPIHGSALFHRIGEVAAEQILGS